MLHDWQIAAAEPFPLEEAWIWEGDEDERDNGASIDDVFTHGIVWHSGAGMVERRSGSIVSVYKDRLAEVSRVM